MEQVEVIKKKKKHSQKSIHSHLLETSGCTCLPGPPPICWAAWNGTPPWCRSLLRPSCPPLWMDGALRPTVQQSAGCRGEEQAAPLTRSFQLTQESSHLSLTVTQHLNFRWGWIRPDQLCLQNPIKKKILSLNRFAIDLLNINLHYLFIYLFFQKQMILMKTQLVYWRILADITSAATHNKNKRWGRTWGEGQSQGSTLILRINKMLLWSGRD